MVTMKLNSFIPLSEPQFSKLEIKNLANCINTKWVSSSGSYVKNFEKKIANYTKSKYAISTINGTSALHISLILLGIQSSHEVIVPSITFIAPINVVRYQNATPIFLGVNKYHTLDYKTLLSFLKKNTKFQDGFTINKNTNKIIKAIIIVHTWGNAAEIDSIIKICKKQNIRIIEDASESLGTFYKNGKYKKKHTGTISDIGCISFNANKIITTGGGGMILTQNKILAKKAEYLVTQAKDNSFKFIHNSIGYNYKMNNIAAAIGIAQFMNFKKILKSKKEIHKEYLKNFKNSSNFSILTPPSFSQSNFWLNLLIIKNKKIKIKNLINKLLFNNIDVRPVWYPNNLQKPYLRFESYGTDGDIEILKNTLCLPSSINLSKKKIYQICKIINE